MQNPTISIITVAFNSEKTIADTIESVLSQSYKNIEYIIIDGFSKDKTIDIINSYVTKMNQNTFKYKIISEKDSGIYDAINKGINLATGDIIGILNSDDYYYDQDVVSKIANAFCDNVDCIYGNLLYINPVTKKISRKWISKEYEKGLFFKSWTPAHPTFYCKKEMYEKYGLYRTDFKIAADVELMFRYLEIKQISYKYLNEFMVIMRTGGISSSGIKSTITITKEMKRAFIDNGSKYNMLRYICYKILKIREIIIK